MGIILDIMRQFDTIQRLAQSVCDEHGKLTPDTQMFRFIDAVHRHVACEESIFEGSDFSAPPEWQEHRALHTQARLCCFWLATCGEANRAVHFVRLREALRDHARHEMVLVSGLVRVLGVGRTSSWHTNKR